MVLNGQGDGLEQRRRRRHALPLTMRQSCYEWTALMLLLAPSLAGMWWFGGVRIWMSAPLLMLSLVGVALCALRPLFFRGVEHLQVPPGFALFALSIAWAGLLCFRAAVPHEARVEWLQLVSCLLVFWAWTELASHRHRWRWLVFVLMFSVTLMAWYALIQEAHGSSMVLALQRPVSYGMRASGAFFCPNHFANLMEIIFPLCLALVLCSSVGFALRLFAGYAMVVMLPALYLTQSRSGWMAVMAGFTTMLCLSAWRKSTRRFLAAAVLVPLVVAGLAVAVWVVSPMVQERIAEARQGNTRTEIWQDTLEIIGQKPWTGFGPGSYRWIYPHFKHHFRAYVDPEFAHNDYLHLLAEQGVIGFIIVAALFAAVFLKLRPFLRDPEREREAYLVMGLAGSVTACLVHAGFDYNFHIFANNHTLVAVAGIVMARLFAASEWEARALSTPGRWALGGGAVAALLLIAALLQVAASDRLFRRGEAQRQDFDLDGATLSYQRALRVDPGYWRPYLGMGDLLRRQNFWNRNPNDKKSQADEAIRFYREAARRNPWDEDPIFGISKIYQHLGDIGQAVVLLQGIVEQVPGQAYYLTELGERLIQAGRYEEALSAFEKAQAVVYSGLAARNIVWLKEKLAVPAPQESIR